MKPAIRLSGPWVPSTKPHADNRREERGSWFCLFLAGIIVIPIALSGCGSIEAGPKARSIAREANILFNQGKYQASLEKYQQLFDNLSDTADRVLFEMGIIYAHPDNKQKNYAQALDCFRTIVKDYPDSAYRQNSQMMILQIQNVIIKDNLVAAQRTQIDIARQSLREKESENIALRARLERLNQKLVELRTEPADRILIEKEARRLTLLSKGEVIKTYQIALGGDPVGPKVMQGDNKTPEGIYTIESRNSASDYHLSLRISYPNAADKKRASARGVSPGGDIMIHGLKNGLSRVGAWHAKIDWTQGCIAVTDQEMEEIERLVPDGTAVEIRP